MYTMENPSMDMIYQAISALYDNPNCIEKEQASKWLGDMQKSIHSWKIADELLRQNKDANSCYFAAQTMRSKVQHSLSELPQEAVVSLRDSLVAHLNQTSSDTSPAILTQLCLALADLALQMPSWQNCARDLIQSFSNNNNLVLLEILTVLPQEIDSTSLKLGENRREEIKGELRTHANVVTMFLMECINNSQNSNLTLKIVKCLTSWIQVNAINLEEVAQNSVIGICLQVLKDHTSINVLHDAATDCVCALFHCLEETNNHEDIERLLFDSIVNLEESYHMAVAHEEDEKAANYARIFTELAESFMHKIIATMERGNNHFAIRALDLVLICVGHHDYEVAEITFNMWFQLSEEVYHRDHQPLTDAFKPHIERLIGALARHCQCEPDHNNLPEEGDDFYEFRQKVMNLIKDVVFIVGSSSVFRQMFSTLHENNSWEQTEAALYIMQSVARNILPDEYEYVPKVVEAILSMPADAHIAVRSTCILLLGELCEWIEQHGACLAPALHYLCTNMHDARLAPQAAKAAQNICTSCGGQARAHAGAVARAAAAADTRSLSPRASATLLRALAAAISALPPAELSQALREAVAVQMAGLREAMNSCDLIQRGSRNDPVVWLDRCAALFRDLKVTEQDISHPALPALADAWPVLRDALERFGSCGRTVERWCRCVRFAVRVTGAHAAPLLAPLAHALLALYHKHAHSAVLYLASVLVDELASSPNCVEELISLLQALLPATFSLLERRDGPRDNPDTVDDLFRLCMRVLQRIPFEFLSSGAVRGVLRCAVQCCALDHRDANMSVMKFLLELAAAGNRVPSTYKQTQALAADAISSLGAELTHALMEASVLHLHTYMLGDVADVLRELILFQKRTGVEGAEWLQSALQRLPRGAAAATDQQCAAFHRAAMQAEKTKELSRLLREFSRLYR